MVDDSQGASNRQPECRTMVPVGGKVDGVNRTATLSLWRGGAKLVRRDLIMGSTALVMTCP